MENFFKETIWGIILLGAVGSIFATTILLVLRKSLILILPKLYKFVVSIAARLVFIAMSSGLKNQTELYLDENLNKLEAYYSSQRVKVTIFLNISTWFFIWLIVRLKLDGLEPYSVEAVSYVSFIFLALTIAIRSYLSLIVPLFFDVKSIVEQKLNNLDPLILSKYNEYKANEVLSRESS